MFHSIVASASIGGTLNKFKVFLSFQATPKELSGNESLVITISNSNWLRIRVDLQVFREVIFSTYLESHGVTKVIFLDYRTSVDIEYSTVDKNLATIDSLNLTQLLQQRQSFKLCYRKINLQRNVSYLHTKNIGAQSGRCTIVYVFPCPSQARHFVIGIFRKAVQCT